MRGEGADISAECTHRKSVDDEAVLTAQQSPGEECKGICPPDLVVAFPPDRPIASPMIGRKGAFTEAI